MDKTIDVVAILLATLLLAIAIDRGIPNSLEAFAYRLERWSCAVVALLRLGAQKLRERHAAIERAERQRRAEEREVQTQFVIALDSPISGFLASSRGARDRSR